MGDVLPAATVSSLPASTSATAATSSPTVAARPSGSRSGDSGSTCGRMCLDVVWDIELDLNSPSPEPALVRGDAPSRRLREEQESPLWDICQVITGWLGGGKGN